MITINGKPHSELSGQTLAEALETLRYDFPLVFIRLDGRVVPQSEWDSERIPEGARLEIYPVVAGG